MVRLVQNSFHGGQLDFEMMGRQDYQRYAKGATLLRNFNIVKKGGLDKRHGFDRLLDLSKAGFDTSAKVRAIPFAYKKSKGFVLLMSKAKCIVVGTAPTYKFKYYTVTGLDGVYTDGEIQELDYQQCGDVMFIASQNHPPAKITHSLGYDGEDGFAYERLDFMMERRVGIPSIANAHINRLAVKDEDKACSLFTEKYVVTAVFDGVETFPCEEFYNETAPEWASEYWASSWDGTTYPRPWTDSQTITLTIKPISRIAEDGTSIWPEEIRVYRKAYSYYGLIGTVKPEGDAPVTFKDNYITPDTSITPPERDSDTDLAGGYDEYPASVALSQQRLIWASTKKDPARVWASEVGDFYNYASHEIQVTSDPIDFKLPVTRFAKINHICEMRKLLMFNSACEWLVDSSSSNSGLTYETIQAYPQSYAGSSDRLKPLICNNSLIFCERTGQCVRRFAYDLSNDGFAGRDVSITSASIFDNNNIMDWTYQQFPFSTLWCVLNDGTMASFEYMEEQDIMAWATHSLGGDGKVVCIATSYAVSPALDDVMDVESYENATHEEIFAVVKRQGSLWLERMRVRNKTLRGEETDVTDSIYHSLCMDGMRVLNSADPTPTNEAGAVWIPADTTDGATISKDEAVKKIAAGVDVYEGFPFEAKYTSVYPFFQGGIGNGQFDVKHIQGIGLRLAPSYGGKVTPVGAKDSEPLCYYYNDPENDHRPVFKDGKLQMFCHDTPIMALPGVNVRDGRVSITQDDPYPFSLLSYEIDYENES